MSLLQLVRVSVGQVGVNPGDVKMISTDNLATITTAGYLNGIGNQLPEVNISRLDVIDCLYSYDPISGTASYAILSVGINNGVITLTPEAGAGSFATILGVQNVQYISGLDTGAANAYVIALTPSITAYSNNMIILFTPLNTNTLASTINVSGIGVRNVVKTGGAPLVAGDFVANKPALLIYNSNASNFELINPQTASGGGGVTDVEVQENQFNIGTDVSAVQNVFEATITPAPAFPYADGIIFTIIPANSNNAEICQVNLNGNGNKDLIVRGGFLGNGDIEQDEPMQIQYNADTDQFYLLNPQTSLSYGTYTVGNYYNSNADSGVADAYVSTNPSMTDAGVVANLTAGAEFTLTGIVGTNTGASTFDYAGEGAVAIVQNDGTALAAGMMVAGCNAKLSRRADNTWQLLNPA